MNRTITLLFFIFSIQFAAAEYDPAQGLEYAYAVALSYCPPDAIESWTCGAACKNLTGYQPFYSNVFNISWEQTLSFSMIYNASAQKFVTAFRGTVTHIQTLIEIMNDVPVPYELVDLPNATVLKYFYTHYVEYLRPTFVAKLQEAYKAFPDYSFVFTGHSLGACLTTLAVFDTITSGLIPKEKITLYNYGSPRVGNYEFAQAVVATVPVIYRITHWRDEGPHIPPCVTNTTGYCQTHALSEGGLGSLVWPAWHIAPEVFYDEQNIGYKICLEAEDRNCADQFGLLDTIMAEHYYYVNVHIACDGDSVVEGEGDIEKAEIELKELFSGW